MTIDPEISGDRSMAAYEPDPAWPVTTESDPLAVYCGNPICGGVDVHPHYHRAPQERIMTGAELIAAERQRQVDSEGYTPEHDRGHHSSLAFAAAVYAAPAPIFVRTDYIDNGVGFANPWPAGWRKPNCSRVRELIRAGALIAAEIDRQLAAGADHA